MTMSTPMLVTFLVYIFGMVLIGLLAYRATNNFDDYILGGRSLGSVVTALSAGASDMSGWLLMGLPGAIFLRHLRKLDRHRPDHRRLPELEAGGRKAARAYRSQQQRPDAAGLFHQPL